MSCGDTGETEDKYTPPTASIDTQDYKKEFRNKYTPLTATIDTQVDGKEFSEKYIPPTASIDTVNHEKEFVITFGKLPELWDKRHQHYFHKYKRTEALEQLLVVYRKIKHTATVDDVKKKINSLRSNYRRELKKIFVSKRTGSNYAPRSWVFRYMHFLNIEQSFSEDFEYQDSLDRYSEPAKEELEEKFESITQPSCSFSPDESQTYESSYNSPTESTDNPHLPELPKMNTLAMYWTEKLEILTNTQRIYAEKAINNVLCEAELGRLNKYSVTINELPRRSGGPGGLL